MANKLFQAFIDTAKTIAGYPITVANGVFMRNGKTLDETQEELITALGPTDISSYADGTITGSIKAACDKADANEAAIANVNSKLGNTDISAIGDGTLTGGLDALNSNLIIESVEIIPSFSAYKVGHTLEIYKQLSDLENGTYIRLGITQYKSVNDYAIISLYSTAPPYLAVGSLWISSTGVVEVFKQSATTECYISGNYIFK